MVHAVVGAWLFKLSRCTSRPDFENSGGNEEWESEKAFTFFKASKVVWGDMSITPAAVLVLQDA